MDNYQTINQEENNMSMNSYYTTEFQAVTGSFGNTIKETQKLFDRGPRWPANMPGWNPKGISAQQFRDQRWLERERTRVAARTAAQLRTKSRTKNG
jgi:hypothetical protein